MTEAESSRSDRQRTRFAVGLTALALIGVSLGGRAAAGEAARSDLSATPSLAAVECLTYSQERGLFSQLGTAYEVLDDQFARSDAIVASEIVFGADSRLVFPRMEYSKRGPSHCADLYFVVADRLTSDEAAAATITWDRAFPADPPLDRGWAPAGAGGVAPGEDGSDGSPGGPGNAGRDGAHAPNLLVILGELTGPLSLDLRGQDGGTGGVGQSGGPGGAGASGRAAVPGLLDCRKGPGAGGDGGDGGLGGRGGRGGNGGLGGTVIVIAPEEQAATIDELLDVTVDGGAAGEGGAPGIGGTEGRAGREGRATPPCRSARRDGKTGQRGGDGVEGEDGDPGESGDYYLLPLPAEQFEEVLGAAFGRAAE